jgi:hypothetical protein
MTGNYEKRGLIFVFILIALAASVYGTSCGGSGSCSVALSTEIVSSGNITTTTSTTTTSTTTTSSTTTTTENGGIVRLIMPPPPSDFSISPSSISFTIEPNTQRIMEFTLTNNEDSEVTANLKIVGSGDQSRNWVKFEDNSTNTYVNITDKKVIRYIVNVPNGTEEEKYYFSIQVQTPTETASHYVTVVVGKSLWTWLNNDIISTEINSPFTSFSTIDTEESVKLINIRFQVKHLLIIIALIIIIGLYFILRKRR